MFFDYARYYLPFALQILTACGLFMGNAWAWLGVSTLILFAVIDSILPDDHSERRIANASVANIPLWLTTLSGPTLVLLLAWTSFGQTNVITEVLLKFEWQLSPIV